ncbi:MAG: phosphonopyruvate decarboxylase, partial [Spirochaetota bacterium]
MMDPKDFVEQLAHLGIDFFTGVPDSLLKDLCAYITEHCPSDNHVIAANEGGAVALAAGYHLATGKAGVVYMQNSGTGNAVNPLLSLADPDVYAIPMLLVIGWRGEPGVHDEPQHKKQGRVQEALLGALGYRYEVMAEDPQEALAQLDSLVAEMSAKGTPVALLVRKGAFAGYKMSQAAARAYPMTREDAIKIILASLSEDDRVVSTTGMASREIYELRDAAGQGHGKDFLTVGSMGHALMIALGIARFRKGAVYCLDGDGAVIMHLGSLAIAASGKPANLRHIILNNGAHDSVGGQPTIGYSLGFDSIAKELGYAASFRAETPDALNSTLAKLALV